MGYEAAPGIMVISKSAYDETQFNFTVTPKNPAIAGGIFFGLCMGYDRTLDAAKEAKAAGYEIVGLDENASSTRWMPVDAVTASRFRKEVHLV